MTLTYRSIGLIVGGALIAVESACGPGVGVTTEESATQTETRGATTEGPGQTEPTTPTEGATEGVTEGATEGVGTTEGPAAAGCERVAGAGDVEWYLRCGGAPREGVNGVAVDAAGSIYVGVDMRNLDGSAPFMIGAFEVVPGDLSDILIVKLDASGEVVWVKHFSGPEDEYLAGLWGCGDGVAIVGGAPANALDLGGGVLAEADFIAAFDGEGAHRWSRGVPILVGDGHVTWSDAACDATGSLALTGLYRGGIDLGGGPIMPADLYDGIVARFDPAGGLLWSHSFGGDGSYPTGRAVAYTPGGEVAVVGSFDGTVDLGGGPLTASNGDDVLVALLGADGAHVWSRQIGPDGLQYGAAVAVDGAGQVVVGGTFLDGITIGADSYVNTFPDAVEDIDGTLYDGFLAFLDVEGAPSSSLQIGTKLDDDMYSLEFDANGVLMMSGFTAEAFTVRAHVDGVPGWQWTTKAWLRGHVALAGDDAVVVATGTGGPVDLGGGVLASHGQEDMVVAKIRR